MYVTSRFIDCVIAWIFFFEHTGRTMISPIRFVCIEYHVNYTTEPNKSVARWLCSKFGLNIFFLAYFLSFLRKSLFKKNLFLLFEFKVIASKLPSGKIPDYKAYSSSMSEKHEEEISQQSTLTETPLPTLNTQVEATTEDTKEPGLEETKPIEIVVNDEKIDVQSEEAPAQPITASEELPQIIINDSQSTASMPDLVINGESLVIDEPQTPVPSEVISDDSSTTASSHSTVMSESLNNDDTKPIVMDESDFQGPVIEFYKNKNILMTGVTGFIGKAILWKLIQALRQDLGYIYILVRSGSIKRSKIGRPSERLRNEVFNNKVNIYTSMDQTRN
jgi:hypothetical protein